MPPTSIAAEKITVAETKGEPSTQARTATASHKFIPMFINHASRTRASACLMISGRISTALSSQRLPGVHYNSKRISSRGDFARLASSLIGNPTHSRKN
jgi:hypothetical protein